MFDLNVLEWAVMKKANAKKIIFTALALLWMVLIFSMSAQNAEESSDLSGSLSYALCRIFVRGFENMDMPVRLALAESLQTLVRKSAHFIEYAVLGFLLAGSADSFGTKRRLLWAAFLSTLYAASDEAHQLFVPGRSGQISDVMLDSAGAVLGAVIFIAAAGLIRKSLKKSVSCER